MARHFLDKAMTEVRSGRTKVFEDFDVPGGAIGCGFHEAVRGVLSHHLVIREGKIANYHPYPPTPWNGSPTDSYGTPGAPQGPVAGSIVACRAACTFISARARRSSRCTRRCSASSTDRGWTCHRQQRSRVSRSYWSSSRLFLILPCERPLPRLRRHCSIFMARVLSGSSMCWLRTT